MKLMNFRITVLYIAAKMYDRFVKKKTVNTFSTILINISSGIGDALMAEPMIRSFKAGNPSLQIHILASRSTGFIFANHPQVQKIFVLRAKWMSVLTLCRQLRKFKYDTYIGAIPSNTLSQVLIPYLSGIPFCVKHRSPHTGSRNYDFLFQRIETIPDGRHRIECNLDLLKHMGITNILPDIKPQIFLSEESVQYAEQILHGKGYDETKLTIGFHPGCNPQAAFKRWAPENYAQLMRYLYETWKAQILIVGGKDEEDDMKKIESLLTVKTLNFVGQTDLLETATLIKHCHFFITNDSGIMHLATAMDVPVFAIFGPKDERHIGPFGNKHTVIRNGKEVNNVTVEQVINTLLQSEQGLKGK
jgi:heptosyltransferase-2